ncbi:glutathione S-transferase N-terminal domain-containing protein [Clostridium sp. MSJ-4]|uniref:Glutathione S-transferase N-terminal domain-containing protein n=1 Tax=Clostridium simiarum TaxID=2841506 RepID=A0ABS6F2L7_9CLOT|nr:MULTISPECIES: glutaredoxin domain-containing protein [Clostridium]MBU5592756.1 glutathione S-transferase N-terminal domain-containing protein [Clostridium simiarum]
MVKIYTTPNCPYCKKARAYFDTKNIEYKDINVLEDKESRKVMIETSGQQSVPVIDIDGEIILGFNKYAVDAALNKESNQ